MSDATLNSTFNPLGIAGCKSYNLTFAASGDTYASGQSVDSYQFTVTAITGTGTTPVITESSGTFTFTATGCTAATVNLLVFARK